MFSFFIYLFCVLITVPVDVFAPNSAWSGFYEYLGKRQTTTFTVTGFNATSGRVSVTLLESSGVSIRLSGKNIKNTDLKKGPAVHKYMGTSFFCTNINFSFAVWPFHPQANRFLGHWKQGLWKTPSRLLQKTLLYCFTTCVWHHLVCVLLVCVADNVNITKILHVLTFLAGLYIYMLTNVHCSFHYIKIKRHQTAFLLRCINFIFRSNIQK